LLAIEAQMAQYVAGLAQQIALVLLVLLPTLEAPTQSRQASRLAAVPYPPGRRIPKPQPGVAKVAMLRPGALRK